VKKSKDSFLKYLRQYFTVHLPTQKQSSPHTITACRQTWNMLLAYVVKAQNTTLEKLTFENITCNVQTGYGGRTFTQNATNKTRVIYE